MADDRIAHLKAREILDSKARPMVEVDVWTADGIMGRGASPCGTSVGRHEAVILRDGGARYGGLGVLRAVRNVQEIIFPAIRGRRVTEQRELDDCLIALDGSPDKSRLGANALYSVSIAAARAGAAIRGIPLYRHLGGPAADRLPVPMFNMVNGGTFGSVRMEFQEFHVVPARAPRYSEALRMGVEIYAVLGDIIRKKYGRQGVHVGSSAGYGAPASDPGEVLDVLLEAAEVAGYGGQCRLGLDCAASHFFDTAAGLYQYQGEAIRREKLMDLLDDLAQRYDLFMIEDPLQEDDFEGFAAITRRIPSLIVGDDLFVANLARVKRGVALGAANGMILKPNMVGTISEAIDAARYAQAHGYRIIGSGRAGGSIDDPIPDIAVAVGAPLVKFGAPRTGERLAKQNCLLRMEEELGAAARFAGPDIFGR